MPDDPIVIASFARTPMGSFQGCFRGLAAHELGAQAVQAAVERAQVDRSEIDEAILGNVLSAGQGQAPARQAVLGAGLPLSTHCTTINKMCGSGMKATMLAHDLLRAGVNRVMVAGGMESMTNAPYLLLKTRSGQRMGHGQLMDHMFLDGLEDAYEKGALMGAFAESCAQRYGFTREAQDEFAMTSLARAQNASKDGSFDAEVTPVVVRNKQGETLVERDEPPFRAQIEKIPRLRPAFRENGTVTAANSSSISDGAAAMVLMRRSTAQRRGIKPRAVILGHSTHAQEPGWFTTAPVGAIGKLLASVNWEAEDVDLFEVNEAFAVVTMAAMREHRIDHSRINVHGGACALGHPVGASGARILVTLLSALEQKNLTRGLASLCIGGGEATAMAIERCP
ncbi:MAG: acetyl-CoA C-acyltransferase [Gammaproteobacteria bacterium]|nr:acetyl-CoA C-acyltransferase [Gammaproteobacteria bacterium]